MKDNRHLCVSFSNGVNWNGIMTLECVQKRADEEYPEVNIDVKVSEIKSHEEDSDVIVHICHRICGNWIFNDLNKKFI